MDQLNTHKSSGFLQKIKELFLIAIPFIFFVMQFPFIHKHFSLGYSYGRYHEYNTSWLLFNSVFALVVLFFLLFKLVRKNRQRDWYYVWLGLSFFISLFFFTVGPGDSGYGWGFLFVTRWGWSLITQSLMIFIFFVLVFLNIKILGKENIPTFRIEVFVCTFFFSYWFLVYGYHLGDLLILGFWHNYKIFGQVILNSLMIGTLVFCVFLILLYMLKNHRIIKVLLTGVFVSVIFYISDYPIFDIFRNRIMVQDPYPHEIPVSKAALAAFGIFLESFIVSPLLFLNIIMVCLLIFLLIKNKKKGKIVPREVVINRHIRRYGNWLIKGFFSFLLGLLFFFIFSRHRFFYYRPRLFWLSLAVGIFILISWIILRHVTGKHIIYLCGVCLGYIGLFFLDLDIFNFLFEFSQWVTDHRMFMTHLVWLFFIILIFGIILALIFDLKMRMWSMKYFFTAILMLGLLGLTTGLMLFPGNNIPELDRQLWKAVKEGNLNVTKKLVRVGASLTIKDNLDNTLLFIAPASMVTYLVHHGLSVNTKNGRNTSPLFSWYYQFDDWDEKAMFLIRYGADIMHKGHHWQNFIEDIEEGLDFDYENYKKNDYLNLFRWERGKYLIREKGLFYSDEYRDGPRTAAGYVKKIGNENLVTVLKKRGEINMVDVKGFAPVHYAVILGDLELVKLLVAKGADVLVMNDAGDTPLSLAVSHGHSEMVVFLNRLLKKR